jgi:hypothetical protein
MTMKLLEHHTATAFKLRCRPAAESEMEEYHPPGPFWKFEPACSDKDATVGNMYVPIIVW